MASIGGKWTSAKEKKLLRDTHGGYAGRSIGERIAEQMDKRRKKMEKLVLQRDSVEYATERGRYEGLGAALALLRSSSLNEEIERSNERLGIE